MKPTRPNPSHFGFRSDPSPSITSSYPPPSGRLYIETPSFSTNYTKDTIFQCGDKVVIGGVKRGTLRYFGRIHTFDGIWCGIELTEPDGKHDGEIDGVRYFSCESNRGIFAPACKVQLDKMPMNVGAPRKAHKMPGFTNRRRTTHNTYNNSTFTLDDVDKLNITYDATSQVEAASHIGRDFGDRTTDHVQPSVAATDDYRHTLNTTFSENNNIADNSGVSQSSASNMTRSHDTTFVMDPNDELNTSMEGSSSTNDLRSQSPDDMSSTSVRQSTFLKDDHTFSPEVRDCLAADHKQYLNLTFGANVSPPSSETKSTVDIVLQEVSSSPSHLNEIACDKLFRTGYLEPIKSNSNHRGSQDDELDNDIIQCLQITGLKSENSNTLESPGDISADLHQCPASTPLFLNKFSFENCGQSTDHLNPSQVGELTKKRSQIDDSSLDDSLLNCLQLTHILSAEMKSAPTSIDRDSFHKIQPGADNPTDLELADCLKTRINNNTTRESMHKLPQDGVYTVMQQSSELRQLKADLMMGHDKQSTRPLSLVSSLSTDTGYMGSEYGMVLSSYHPDMENSVNSMVASGPVCGTDCAVLASETVSSISFPIIEEMTNDVRPVPCTEVSPHDAGSVGDVDMKEIDIEHGDIKDVTIVTGQEQSEIEAFCSPRNVGVSADTIVCTEETSLSRLNQCAIGDAKSPIIDVDAFENAPTTSTPKHPCSERRGSSKRSSLPVDSTMTKYSKLKKNEDSACVDDQVGNQKKVKQRAPPKSIWKGIMSQIESNKESKPKPKKAVQSTLSAMFSQAPTKKVAETSGNNSVSSTSSQNSQISRRKSKIATVTRVPSVKGDTASVQPKKKISSSAIPKISNCTDVASIPKPTPTGNPGQNKRTGSVKDTTKKVKSTLPVTNNNVQEREQQLKVQNDNLRESLQQTTRSFDVLSIVAKHSSEHNDVLSNDLNAALSRVDALESEISQRREELECLRSTHNHNMETVERQHEEKMTAVRTEMQSDLFTQLDEMQQRHLSESHNFQTEVRQLKEEHDRHLYQSQSEHHNSILCMQQKHDTQMEELHQQHQNEVAEIFQRWESIRLSLMEKVESLKNECDDLRQRTRLSEEAMLRESDIKVQLAIAPYINTAKEVESLKTVLDMKNEEIRHLQKNHNDFQRQLEKKRIAEEKVISLTQKIENLEAILNLKTDNEKQLADKYQHLLRKVNREAQLNKRLSQNCEELRYRMSQSEDNSCGATSFPNGSTTNRRSISPS